MEARKTLNLNEVYGIGYTCVTKDASISCKLYKGSNSLKTSMFRWFSETRESKGGITSNRGSACRGENNKLTRGTHRPSRSERKVGWKPFVFIFEKFKSYKYKIFIKFFGNNKWCLKSVFWLELSRNKVVVAEAAAGMNFFLYTFFGFYIHFSVFIYIFSTHNFIYVS